MTNSTLFSLMNLLVGKGYTRTKAYAEAKKQLTAQTEPIQIIEIDSKDKGWNKRAVIGKIGKSTKTKGLFVMTDFCKVLNMEKSVVISTYRFRTPQKAA